MKIFHKYGLDVSKNFNVRNSVRLRDFLWHPRKVKVLWIFSLSYWGGMIAAEAKPEFLSFFHTLLGGYIAIFVCPPLVFMVLSGLFLRAWFSQLDMSEWEGVPEPDFYHQLHQNRVSYREFGGPFDPTLDPTDPRSGILHLRHIGVIED